MKNLFRASGQNCYLRPPVQPRPAVPATGHSMGSMICGERMKITSFLGYFLWDPKTPATTVSQSYQTHRRPQDSALISSWGWFIERRRLSGVREGEASGQDTSKSSDRLKQHGQCRDCEELTLRSKYPNVRYLPKSTITIPNIETLHTLR